MKITKFYKRDDLSQINSADGIWRSFRTGFVPAENDAGLYVGLSKVTLEIEY